jgi:hypothetical protein
MCCISKAVLVCVNVSFAPNLFPVGIWGIIIVNGICDDTRNLKCLFMGVMMGDFE